VQRISPKKRLPIKCKSAYTLKDCLNGRSTPAEFKPETAVVESFIDPSQV
jgi:hypothetical protein